jgi:hypothetical protein
VRLKFFFRERTSKTQNNKNQIGKNNIALILIEWWDWEKKINFYKKSQEKKIEVKRIRTNLKNIIYKKLKLNDEIKNKQNIYKIANSKYFATLKFNYNVLSKHFFIF